MKYSKELQELIRKYQNKERTLRNLPSLIYHEIKELTNFLPNQISINVRIWYIMNQIEKVPTCIECNKKPVRWNARDSSPSNFCSTKCSANSKITKEKTRQSNLEKYGVESTLQVKKFRDKGKRQILRNMELNILGNEQM